MRKFKISLESLTDIHSTFFLFIYFATSGDSSVLNSNFDIFRFCTTSLTASAVVPGVADKPTILIILFSSNNCLKTYIIYNTSYNYGSGENENIFLA